MACTCRDTTPLRVATDSADRRDDGTTTLPVAPTMDALTSAFIFQLHAFTSSA